MTNEQKIIRRKLGLLELAKQLGSVSQACRILGYGRDSFYRFIAYPTPKAQRPVPITVLGIRH